MVEKGFGQMYCFRSTDRGEPYYSMVANMDVLNSALGELLDRVDHDPAVLGLVVTGSQARDGMVTPHSDTDVLLVVDADGRERWRGSHSLPLDIGIYTLDDLAKPAMPRENIDDWWNRYAFTHSLVLRDKLDGDIQRLVDGQATLTAEEATTLALDFLDGYVNFAVRSLKSVRDGRRLESRLDAVESISYALVTIYALEHRVRPYNKYLLWDLAHYPLQNPEFESTRLLSLLDGIQSESHGGAQRSLFGAVEVVARRNGGAQVIDDWGNDLNLLR